MSLLFSYGKTLSNAFPLRRQEGAKNALHILYLINLLNFADRYVPAAVKSLIKDELHLTDFETSLPNSGMILVFMVAAVLFGHLADKRVCDRRLILCGGVMFWSLATAVAGLSQNLWQLILFRSLVGVGEAAYGTVAPPMISDFFPKRDRNAAYGIYYLAIPVGGALGFAVGGVVGGMFGWRWAFVACGVPGLIVALAILKINDPVRGINDEVDGGMYPEETERLLPTTASTTLSSDGARSMLKEKNEHYDHKEDTEGYYATNPMTRTSSRSSKSQSCTTLITVDESSDTSTDVPPDRSAYQEYGEILSNYQYAACVLGLAANNFALGGLADWVTVYCERYTNASISEAGLVIGAATVVGGIAGTVIGSKVAEHYDGKVKSAYFLVCALFTIPAAIFLFLAMNTSSKELTYAFIFLGEIMIWTCQSPINSMSLTVIPVALRARAAGLVIFLQHILGDVFSPPLIGYISDQSGSLRTGMQICWMATLLSGVFWGWGYYFLDPLPVADHNLEANVSKNSLQSNLLGEVATKARPLTYSEVLCPSCVSGVPDADEPYKDTEPSSTLIHPDDRTA